MPTEENIRMKDLVPFATVPPDVVVPVDSLTMGSGHLTPQQIAEYGGHESDRDIFVAVYGETPYDEVLAEYKKGKNIIVCRRELFLSIYAVLDSYIESESGRGDFTFFEMSVGEEGAGIVEYRLDVRDGWHFVDRTLASVEYVDEMLGNVESLLAAL